MKPLTLQMIAQIVKKILASIIRRTPDGVFYDMSYPFNLIPFQKNRVRLREEVRRRIQEGNPAGDYNSKVFGIGLSKTGTTSLSRALEIIGYEKSLHWTENSKVLGWPEFSYGDAATDIPCSAQFESLYYTFKNSKFIYTIRSFEDWKNSIKNHLNISHPREIKHLYKERRFWEESHGFEFYNNVRRVQLLESLYGQYNSWENSYRAHDQRVRQFFEDKPDDRFLEMNIVAGDGWDVLCPFLEVDLPNKPFPHANKSES